MVLSIKRNRTFIFATIVLIVIFLLSILFLLHVFEQWQNTLSDTLFTEKKPLEDIVIVAIDDKSLQEIGRWPWPREKFLELFKKLDEAKVIGFDVAFFEPYNNKVDQDIGNLMRSYDNVIIPIEFTSFDDINGEITVKERLDPIKELNNIDTGFVNIFTDDDGVTRSMPLVINNEKSFALKISEKAVGEITYPDKIIRINFIGKPGKFTYISASDAINKKYDFKDKIVLVGATAVDLHDNSFVPTSQGIAMPGVEIHASIIQTLITKDFLNEEPKFLVILSMIILSIIIALSLYKLRLLFAGIISIGLVIGYITIAIILFSSGIILNLVYPVITIFFTFISIVSYSYVFSEKEKKKTLQAFQQYVSPEIIKEITQHPEKLKLGGEKKEITIMFSDIRGFTSFSEKLSPEELVHFLNEYLTEMSDIILENKGVIDKYIGDAIMAFWGAPLENKQHSIDACRSALAMSEKLKHLQEIFAKRNLPHLDIGIGINTGDAVVGNMGSSKRFDYTAMGDAINLGSRLESITKQYGVRIVISGSTYEQVKDIFVCRELDLVRVKGKKNAVPIYELIAEKGKEFDVDFIKYFEEGVKIYLNQEWDKAILKFKECLKIKEDKVSELYIERCNFYKNNPPGENWDKVWEWKIK